MFKSTPTALDFNFQSSKLESPLLNDMAGALETGSRSEASFSFSLQRAFSSGNLPPSDDPIASFTTSLDHRGDFDSSFWKDQSWQSTLHRYGQQEPARELVVIDQGVENWQELLGDIRQQRDVRSLDVVTLDRDRDGIQQITEALSGFENLKALHVISHGVDGGLMLGNGVLTDRNLSAYAGELTGWRDALSGQADIMLYGCNLAAGLAGKSLVDGIAVLTGADVAASSDMTGAAALGGNWSLEFQRGEIESRVAFSASMRNDWQFTLDVNIDQAWLTARGPGPYYLNAANETYILQTDVTTPGTAFAIIAPGITFDLNGHTITYDNAAPLVIPNSSLETGTGAAATGWNFAAAPNAERFAGVYLKNEIYDGSYSLKFNNTTANQHVVSTSTVTLLPNTTYSLSAMFEYGGTGTATNPGVKSYARLTGTGLPTREVFWNSTNYRGIQLREGIFRTGGTTETYNVTVGIEGHASSVKPVFIDDLKIQRTGVYGVFAGPVGWATSTYNDLTQFGNSPNSVITNGTITQGQDKATWGHAVMIHDSNGSNINDLNITVSGANTSAIFGYQQGPYRVTVANNDITSNVKTVSSRDNNHGTVILDAFGVISGNTIDGGPLSGIRSGSSVGTPSSIFGNTVRIKASNYTNAFGIIGSFGTDVYDNVIETHTGEYSGRGMRADGTATKTALVYNNVIRVRTLPTNQEYEGVPLGGSYGVQLEGSGYVNFYNNEIFAYSNGVEAHAFRANSLVAPIHVHDNKFHAISDGSKMASVIKLHDIAQQDILFEDNALLTNYGIIGGSLDAHMDIIRSTLTVTDPLSTLNPVVFESGYAVSPALNAELTFTDTIFADVFSQNYLANAVTRAPLVYGGQIESRMAFAVDWTTVIQVNNGWNQAVGNAGVVVKDKNNNVVASGSTDANGRLETVTRQFRTQGATKTEYNDYKVTVTHDGVETEQSFAADKQQTIEVVVGPNRGDYVLDYQNGGLIVYGTEADNAVSWTDNSPLQFTIDGFVFDIQSPINWLEFRGLGGVDSIQMIGSSGSDTLFAQPGTYSFTMESGFQVFATQFEDLDGIAGSGTNDAAFFYDSAGDDVFTSSPAFASLEGTGYRQLATGFDRVAANSSTSIDQDVAHFYGSAGNDQLLAAETFTSMTSGAVVNRANGFDRTFGYSTSGLDTAYLIDSAGNNQLSGDFISWQMTGDGFRNSASGFYRTFASGTPGTGYDSLEINGAGANVVILQRRLAILRSGSNSLTVTGFSEQSVLGSAGSIADVRLLGSSGSDSLTTDPTQATMSGVDYTNQLSGFKRVRSFANLGALDVATFYDSTGNDEYAANSVWARMQGTGFQNEAYGFGQTTGISSTSTIKDTAVLSGSAGQDTLIARPEYVQLSGATYCNRAEGFDVTSSLSLGGPATANIYDSAGNDTLVGDMREARINGSGYSNFWSNFQTVNAFATTGSDLIALSDSVGDDLVTIGTRQVNMVGGGRTINATGFFAQNIKSVRGGSDTLNFQVGDGDNQLTMYEAYSVVSGTGYYNRADGFKNILAIATEAGGYNRVTLYGSTDIDQMRFEQNYGTCTRGSWSRRFEGFDLANAYVGTEDGVVEDNPDYELFLIR